MEGFKDKFQTLEKEEHQCKCVCFLAQAYFDLDELLTAKANIECFPFTSSDSNILRALFSAGKIETSLRNDDAAIDHLGKLYANDPQQKGFIDVSVELGVALLNQLDDNEAEAFELFQESVGWSDAPIWSRLCTLSHGRIV